MWYRKGWVGLSDLNQGGLELEVSVVKCKERVVTYRLERLYRERLDAIAQQHRISPNQLARMVLVMHLENTVALNLKDQLVALRAELGVLRDQVGALSAAVREANRQTLVPPSQHALPYNKRH